MLLLAVMLGLLNLLLLGGLLALHHRQRRLARALAEARLAFERWAGGDLDARMVPRDGDPPGQLAAAFNGMAAHLAEQIRLLEQQRDQQEAVFVSMVEGVVALDNGGRILR
ncbi:MAG TPA: hypothetical protein PK634_12345, partial [Kiritimatiellia bacterium]|nr:hypothetical protein [Kiritimatiellia bacterium]